MMSLDLFKIVSALLLLVVSLASGLVPYYAKLHEKHPPSFAFGEALASGVFLGAALFHMLPKADAGFRAALMGNHQYPFAYLFFALGFSLLLFLEKLILQFTQHRYIFDKRAMAYVLAIVLSIHAFIEGGALGINITYATTMIIFTAIMVHKGTESFALASSLRQGEVNIIPMQVIFGIFSLMTPIGIIIGTLVELLFQTHSWQLLQAIFNACAAGTFFYIATLHHKSHHHKDEQFSYLREFFAMGIGLTLMACLAIWI